MVPNRSEHAGPSQLHRAVAHSADGTVTKNKAAGGLYSCHHTISSRRNADQPSAGVERATSKALIPSNARP